MFLRRVGRHRSLGAVDSTTVIDTPSACGGIGFGFISRIADRSFTLSQLRAFVEADQRLRIVSAFYATEDIVVDGRRMRGARALSVVRPTVVTTTVAGRGS